MDDKQDIAGSFNLHTYGYIAHLLWGGVQNATWVMKACKAEGDDDAVNVIVRQVLPVWLPNVGRLSFRNGFILITGVVYFQRDGELSPENEEGGGGCFPSTPEEGETTINSADFLPHVYSAFSGKGAVPPVVYHVEATLATKVEVRHKFVDKPKIAILGEDSEIHAKVFDDAGLVEGIHYQALGTDTELLVDQTNCFTLVSNSHDTLKKAPERASAVHKFTSAGGNFFAQGSAIVAYEAQAAAQGRRFLFVTPDAGIDCKKNKDCESEFCSNKKCSAIKKGKKMLTRFDLSQPDLALAQIETGIGFDLAQGGSFNLGNVSFARGEYNTDKAYLELTDGTVFKAMAGTVIGYPANIETGGMVFYLAGDSYDKCDGNSINGARMLLNAMLVPAANRGPDCGLGITDDTTITNIIGEPSSSCRSSSRSSSSRSGKKMRRRLKSRG
jgi:hypothetical protein